MFDQAKVRSVRQGLAGYALALQVMLVHAQKLVEVRLGREMWGWCRQKL